MSQASALFVVFAALGALWLLLRCWGPRPSGAGMRVRESCALGPKARLHVVEVDGERLLVGSSESGVSLLRTLAASEEPAASPAPAPRAVAAPARPPWARIGAGAALLLFAFALFVPEAAWAEGPAQGPQLVLSVGGGADGTEVAPALELLALLTVVSIAPSILLMATCFTRIVIVLAFVRQAVGVQHLPPNQVLVGLSLFLTLFVMAPVGEQIHASAWTPYRSNEISLEQATDRALQPVRRFMLGHTREADLALFVDLAQEEAPESLDEIGTATLLPAFLISELRTAFEIGFMVFLPFLVIDLVISSMLISMGMIVLPPVVVALPFKIMLFVLADGWNLILGSLIDGLR